MAAAGKQSVSKDFLSPTPRTALPSGHAAHAAGSTLIQRRSHAQKQTYRLLSQCYKPWQVAMPGESKTAERDRAGDQEMPHSFPASRSLGDGGVRGLAEEVWCRARSRRRMGTSR